jgi:hypothetical protein
VPSFGRIQQCAKWARPPGVEPESATEIVIATVKGTRVAPERADANRARRISNIFVRNVRILVSFAYRSENAKYTSERASMGPGESGLGDRVAGGRSAARRAGAMALFALLALGVCVSVASAGPLSMRFTEARANVGVQLSDAALFAAPDTAPFEAQIGPAGESITAGALQVPQFSTHITAPIDADVTVDFDIGAITGSFVQATGALTLKGEAGGTLTSEGKECTVSTEPAELTLTTTGSSGGASPRAGVPFAAGLTGAGAIAGQWSDMHAAPIGGDTTFCSDVEARIEGPGGIWLTQEGDVVAPSAPQLTSTDPASPGSSEILRILGAAEVGSTVRVYTGPNCTGLQVATGSAAELGSPGIRIATGEGTSVFSATATDAAHNTSVCSAPITYVRDKPLAEGCVVPELAGRTLARARAALKAAECRLGKVHRPKRRKGKGLGPLVVKASMPPAGKILKAGGKVDLRLGPKPRKARP